MEERVFTEDFGSKWPRGRRLTLSSRKEWEHWFPDFERYTKSVDELAEAAMPSRRGRPPKEK